MSPYPFPLSWKNRFPTETTPDGNFDPKRARQYWHDPRALDGHLPNDPYPIPLVDPNDGGHRLGYITTCGYAAVANIDGVPSFPQPAQGPSGVILEMAGGLAQAHIDAGDLILPSDLETLTARIFADTKVQPVWREQGPLTNAGEWRLCRAQTTQTAGRLWNAQNANGVGYPGKWSYDAGYVFAFADVDALYFPDPNACFFTDPVPCPMDALKPGEYLIPPPLPMSPEPWVQLSLKI